jgi:hypothetical protein
MSYQHAPLRKKLSQKELENLWNRHRHQRETQPNSTTLRNWRTREGDRLLTKDMGLGPWTSYPIDHGNIVRLEATDKDNNKNEVVISFPGIWWCGDPRVSVCFPGQTSVSKEDLLANNDAYALTPDEELKYTESLPRGYSSCW